MVDTTNGEVFWDANYKIAMTPFGSKWLECSFPRGGPQRPSPLLSRFCLDPNRFTFQVSHLWPFKHVAQKYNLWLKLSAT
jgi:hypothetical protein